MTTIPGSLNRIKMKSKRQPSQCDHYSGNHSCTQSSNAQCTYNGDCDTLRRIGIDAKSPTRTIAPSTSMTSSVSPIIHLKTITVTQAIARSHTFTILWLLFIEFFSDCVQSERGTNITKYSRDSLIRITQLVFELLMLIWLNTIVWCTCTIWKTKTFARHSLCIGGVDSSICLRSMVHSMMEYLRMDQSKRLQKQRILWRE
eukprot:489786_1